MEKEVKKKVTKKEKKVVEYFTDEMAKSIFLFQDKIGKGSKPFIATIKI
jgi:hypothetical protein